MSLPPSRWKDLLADFTLAAAFIVAAAVFAAWISSGFAAGPGIEFDACSKKTCKSIEHDASLQEVVASGGHFYKLPEDIVGITTIPGCPQCTGIKSRDKSQAIVMGSPKDIACKIWPGQNCGATK